MGGGRPGEKLLGGVEPAAVDAAAVHADAGGARGGAAAAKGIAVDSAAPPLPPTHDHDRSNADEKTKSEPSRPLED